ncbi:MAG TPA: glycosyltransferase [Thermoplasmata archaeon]|nr:glycosyltransferase [Thermoplasmata archaeon]
MTSDALSEEPVRIVLVTPFFYPHAGGVETHVRQLARGFALQGQDVVVLTARFDPDLPAQEDLEGYRIARAPCRAVLLNTPIDPAVGRVLKGLKADIVHLHYPPPLTSYFAVRALQRSPVPICLTYHCDLYLPGPWGRVLTEAFQRIFLTRTLARVDRIIVHTRSYGMTSAVLRGRPLEIIPSVVDLDRFRPGLDASDIRRDFALEGKRVLAFTGRLVPHKGVDVILRALAELPSDVVLLAIGSGPRFAYLRRLAYRLGVPHRVRFLTEVSDVDLPRYLCAADLFVFPSQNRLEGFGLAVAEAMAVGLPVVTADMPGVREVIEPGKEGLLAEPLIASDLAARIREILDDDAMRARMAAAARKRAEQRYGVETVTGQLLKLYAEVLADR